MAVFNAKSASMWLHDVAMHDMVNQINLDMVRETSDASVFGNAARTVTAGLVVVTASASGYIDFDGPHAELDAALSDTDLVVTIGPTSTEGDTAVLTKGLMANWQPLDATLGETAAMSVALAGRQSVAPVSGTLVHAEAARTSTANGTAYQLGAVASGESVYGNLHVLAVSGTNPTLDVVVASDSAEAFDQSAEDQLTFTQATDLTAEQQSAAGAITDDWWRAEWTIGGTDTPTFTFAIAVGIA